MPRHRPPASGAAQFPERITTRSPDPIPLCTFQRQVKPGALRPPAAPARAAPARPAPAAPARPPARRPGPARPAAAAPVQPPCRLFFVTFAGCGHRGRSESKPGWISRSRSGIALRAARRPPRRRGAPGLPPAAHRPAPTRHRRARGAGPRWPLGAAGGGASSAPGPRSWPPGAFVAHSPPGCHAPCTRAQTPGTRRAGPWISAPAVTKAGVRAVGLAWPPQEHPAFCFCKPLGCQREGSQIHG